MAIKLRKVQRKNPLQPDQIKWHLTQETAGSVGIAAIAKEIEGRSSLSHGDVLSVLNNLVEVVPIFLKLGQSVKLEGFGTFRVSVKSKGETNPASLTTHDVTGARLLFLPSKDLKRGLENISYEITEN